MKLYTSLPRTRVGQQTVFFTVLLMFFTAAALRAQQSSSSTNAPQPAPAPATATAAPAMSFRDHLFVEGGAGGSFGAGLVNGQYVSPGWTVMGGGGYSLNRKLALLLEADYFHNKMPTTVLQTAQQSSGSYAIWAFSANPVFHIYRNAKYGAYAIGGGGYSHVGTSFGKPIGTLNCNIYSGLGYANFTNFCNGKITGSSYSSNQPMYDFGLGMDARLYPNRRETLFVQARYIKLMTPANQLPTPNLGLVDITGGVRW